MDKNEIGKIKKIFILCLILFLSGLGIYGCDSSEIRKLKNEVRAGKASIFEHQDLCELYYDKEQYENAIKCSTSLIERCDGLLHSSTFAYSCGLAYSYRGKSLYLLGKKEQATEDLVKAYQESSAYFELGEIFYKKGNYNEVVYCMDQILERLGNKKYYSAFGLRGMALYLLGDKEAGTQNLFQAHGWTRTLTFMREHGIKWVGKEKDEYDRLVRQGTGNSRTTKNFEGRDQVFNALRDDINDSNMSWSDKQKAKVKLHDDMYKE